MQIIDYAVEDASFLRLNTLTVGYTFPKKWMKSIYLTSLRLYFTAYNLFCITGYDGYDPEVGVSTASANVYGLDNGRYPSPTSFAFGLTASF